MGKKLPRRVMSHTKRGAKAAEEFADLDLMEGAIGNPETDGPDGGPRFTHAQLIAGFALGIVFLIALMFVGKAMFASADGNYSMLPDGYREATGLDTAAPSDPGAGVTAYADNGRSTLPSAPRSDSPFPEPQGEMPIILKITCPDGTVHIATGPNEADAVCIRGRLVQEPVATPTAQETATSTDTPPTPTARATVTPLGLPASGSR